MQNSAPFHPVGQAHLMSPAIRDRPIDTSRLPKNDIINFINNLPEATFITPIKNGKVNDLTQMGSIGRCTPGYVFVIFRRVMVSAEFLRIVWQQGLKLIDFTAGYFPVPHFVQLD